MSIFVLLITIITSWQVFKCPLPIDKLWTWSSIIQSSNCSAFYWYWQKIFHPAPLLIFYGFSPCIPFVGFIPYRTEFHCTFFSSSRIEVILRWLLSHFISWAAIIGNAVRENDLVPVKRLSKAKSKRSKTRCSGKFCILYERKEQGQKV